MRCCRPCAACRALLTLLSAPQFTLKKRAVYERRRAYLASLPGFWARCLTIHSEIAACITEEDAAVLDHMQEARGLWASASTGMHTVHTAAGLQLSVLPLPGREDDSLAYIIQLQLSDCEACPAQTISKTLEWDQDTLLWKVSCSGVEWHPDSVRLCAPAEDQDCRASAG